MRNRNRIIIVLLLIGVVFFISLQFVIIPHKNSERNKYLADQQEPATHDLTRILKYKNEYMGNASNNANSFPSFVQPNTQLIGLSVDSNASHLAWVYNIYSHTGIEIPFPVIDDRSLKVSNLYGMISPAMSEVATVRTVYIIDPQGILRTILYYPLTTGRNIPEILRILDALQVSDAEKIATPANWMPGMPVIIPAPTTYEGLIERLEFQNGYSCMDWYLCFKDINKETKDGY